MPIAEILVGISLVKASASAIKEGVQPQNL